MSQTLVPSTRSFDDESNGLINWASPGSDLWVASLTDAEGVHFLGFVEHSLDEYIAVDGAGASRGRHDDLDSAKRMVQAAHAPVGGGTRSWSEAGAPVLTVRALRAR